MKYQPPFNNGGDANASWVNGNPTTGTQGSIPSAAAFEQPLREMHALIAKSGLTPSDADLTQISQAVRSQALNYRAAGGTANALTVTLDPPITTAPPAGLPLRVLLTGSNTAAATLDAGWGAAAIQSATGALSGGELRSGTVIALRWTGAVWMMDPAKGVLLRTTVYSTAGTHTFERLPHASYIAVEGVGGGGAGGGAFTTDSVSVSVGSGGFSGAYGRGEWPATSVPASVTVTIGAGGVGVTGTIGGSGTATSFGALMTLGGGPGGTTLTTPNPRPEGGGTPPTASGANICSASGAPGGIGTAFAAGVSYGGFGGSTPFGLGGGAVSPVNGGPGASASGAGAGGGGAMNFTNQSTQRVGGNGKAGLIIIREYA